jgi:serine/threonine-protein kinase HipA
VKKPPLHVFTGSLLAGSLNHSDREADTILFGYRQSAHPEDAVSVTMPVRADQYDSMAGLLPIFEMNLPEGALKERLRMQFAKSIPEFDDLDLLSIVGSSQIGRLRYTHQEHLRESVPTQDLSEILTYKGSADLFAHLLERFATYSGISGMQPKVLVREIALSDKVTQQGATHIVKSFDPGEFPELAANEWVCTRGASAAGIATSRVRMSENRQFLIVDRFDLTADGRYLGTEDFCVLNGRRAHGRYDGSYENIAKRITDYVTANKLAAAREQFVLMVAYACAIENGDAHLKNFSVLYAQPEGEISLAPAYDLVCTSLYMPRDKLALTLNGSKDYPDRASLVQFIRHVTGKSEASAASIIEQVIAGVHVAIAQTRLYAKRHADSAEFAQKLTAIMKRGIARLAASRATQRAAG